METSPLVAQLIQIAIPGIAVGLTHVATSWGKNKLMSEPSQVAARAMCAALSLIVALITIALTGDAASADVKTGVETLVYTLINFYGATGIYHIRENPVT